MTPQITSLKPDSYKVTITWQQLPRCFEQFLFVHEVQWKEESQSEWSTYTLQLSATQYTITGLTAATSYNIQLRAKAMTTSSVHFSNFTKYSAITSSGMYV